jgi:hypothetical protein
VRSGEDWRKSRASWRVMERRIGRYQPEHR